MHFIYTNTPDDYLAATRYQMQQPPSRSRWARWINLTLMIMMLLWCLSMAWMSWQIGSAWTAVIIISLVSVYAGMTFFHNRILLAFIKWHSHKLFAKQNHPKYAEYFRQRDLELANGRLIEHSAKGAFVTKLKYVREVTSIPDHTLVVGPIHFYIIPRREDQQLEYDAFVTAIRDQWSLAKA